jgi:hypothetical protein
MAVCTLYVLCEAYLALAGPTKVHCFSVICAHPVQLCRLPLEDMLLALPRCLGWVTFRIQFAPLGRRQKGTQAKPLRPPRGSPSSLISETRFRVAESLAPFSLSSSMNHIMTARMRTVHGWTQRLVPCVFGQRRQPKFHYSWYLKRVGMYVIQPGYY